MNWRVRPRTSGVPRRLARLGVTALLVATGTIDTVADRAAAAPGATAADSAAAAGSGRREAHVDNPFVGGAGYVNPEWRAQAESVPGGYRVSRTPTGVWIDRVAKIAGAPGAMGLRAHLDAALAQGARYVQVVVNNLPDRNCERSASLGDFGPTELPRYKAEFIDPIVKIESDPAYGRLRIVNVVELNSIQNLMTSYLPPGRCLAVAQTGAYTEGLRYAVERLHRAGSNVYTYLDAANHGRFGWDSNLGPAAAIYADLVGRTADGLASVDGFITNAGDYAVTTEPYFTSTTLVAGTPVRQSTWVDWNSFVDEVPYAQAMRNALVSLGFSPSLGMLIDTSRNGWGGPDRPTAASTSVDLNTFVDGSRTDRRAHIGNWCNQSGAGLGERPRTAPAPGIDAYVWVAPPGRSDGSPTADPMCDPASSGTLRNGYNPTGALPDAPPFGEWFPAQFTELMANAYPPLP